MDEEQQSGITFGEICSMIWKRIIWILAISVVVTVVVGLLAKFVINPGKTEYEITFMIDYPDSNRKIYPDGREFRYQTIVYADNLEAVKNSDERFKNVDTEKMASSQDIKIKEQSREVTSTEVQDLGIYTITVKGKYFNGAKQVNDFLHALCDYTLKTIVTKVDDKNFNASLVGYDSVATFERQIEILENQQKFLLDQYDAYNTLYGNFTYENKTINVYRSDLVNIFNGELVKLSVLKEDLSNNKYLHKQTEKDILTKIASLNREKEKNDAILANLNKRLAELIELYKDTVSTEFTFEPFHTEIVSLEKRNAQIDVDIAEYYTAIGYLEQPDGSWLKPSDTKVVDETNFREDLEYLHGLIVEQTALCKSVVTALYATESSFVYEQSNAVVTASGSTLMYALVGFAGAFILSGLVFCIVDKNRAKKTAVKAQAKAADEGAENAALRLEAAVASDEEDKKD